MPTELQEILGHREGIKFHQSTDIGGVYKDRSFFTGTIPISNDESFEFSIVVYANSEWDFLHINFRDCLYQDRPKEQMLQIMKAILAGSVKNKPTFFRKRSRWVVYTDDGQTYYPYESN